jgi:hypothetical protein
MVERGEDHAFPDRDVAGGGHGFVGFAQGAEDSEGVGEVVLPTLRRRRRWR